MESHVSKSAKRGAAKLSFVDPKYSKAAGCRVPKAMRNMLKNVVIAATSSSAIVLLFFAIRRSKIDVLSVWSWAALAALCYRWFAVRLSIYGKGGITPEKWKNGLLGIAILIAIQIASRITGILVHVSNETPVAVALAVLVSMLVSEAQA